MNLLKHGASLIAFACLTTFIVCVLLVFILVAACRELPGWLADALAFVLLLASLFAAWFLL